MEAEKWLTQSMSCKHGEILMNATLIGDGYVVVSSIMPNLSSLQTRQAMTVWMATFGNVMTRFHPICISAEYVKATVRMVTVMVVLYLCLSHAVALRAAKLTNNKFGHCAIDLSKDLGDHLL